MTDSPLDPVEMKLRVLWAGVEEVPIQTANQFLVQIDAVGDRPDQVILAIGQLTPPPVIGTLEERQEELRNYRELRVLPLARYSITPARLREVVLLLTQIQAAFEGDPQERRDQDD